jgi:hypothetical protein
MIFCLRKPEYLEKSSHLLQIIAKLEWFSPGTPFSSTNKTDRRDITEILLKVALDTINPNQTRKIKKLLALYLHVELQPKQCFKSYSFNIS